MIKQFDEVPMEAPFLIRLLVPVVFHRRRDIS